jgi:hypothetical protein
MTHHGIVSENVVSFMPAFGAFQLSDVKIGNLLLYLVLLFAFLSRSRKRIKAACTQLNKSGTKLLTVEAEEAFGGFIQPPSIVAGYNCLLPFRRRPLYKQGCQVQVSKQTLLIAPKSTWFSLLATAVAKRKPLRQKRQLLKVIWHLCCL